MRPQRAAAEPAGPPADNREACGQTIVSAYRGAKFAGDEVTRTQAQAQQRAQAQLDRLVDGADFAALAKAESDAPTSGPRGGVVGTFARGQWPAVHQALVEPLFGLAVGALAPAPLQAPYGVVVLKRCPVEKVRSRHILIRYRGATRADRSVRRSRRAARKLAQRLHDELADGADFAALAKRHSEDGSSARGGDLGAQGRGRFAWPFEQALFALRAGERAPITETEFGFHIIERLPDD